ncbi:hypothetical protein D8674_012927 [Pyrus ussuriensis x Pyrus communis]|uniref:Uncharacterized protein n=1 Tax=Pyrus ussuriensis x Pyrus communis TaxID=2448454 RepID=A0A5N5GP36_9ROSA|nr:hypothetical protein D8674_012927 [Pyrus ussuriensis x Pyrus communis]
MNAASSPQNDNPPPIVRTWSIGTVCLSLVIWHSVNHVALPIEASRFRNTDFARALLKATTALANYKEVCVVDITFLLSTYQANIWTEMAIAQEATVQVADLKDAHEAKIRQYIDAATSKELKAKEYQKDLIQVKAKLRLERQAKAKQTGL